VRIAYFDCIGGASGDMLLGALVDAGVSSELISDSISAMDLKNCDLEIKTVMKGALSATKVNVITPKKETHRHLKELLQIIDDAAISETVRQKAREVLTRIAKIEAGIHGASLEEVHLHEIGGDDTLIDIVGFLMGLEWLKIDSVFASPLPLARGWVNSAHGRLPLPAPATLSLLKGTPIHFVDDIQMELVTPTGAALLTSTADSFGGFPDMSLGEIGTGAGGYDLPFPNVIRLWLGESKEKKRLITENLIMLETNIDDMSPELHGHVMESLLHSGVLDVTFTPIHMKKNRPAIQLNVLCQPNQVDKTTDILLKETTTLGIRQSPVDRMSLPRIIETVNTIYGPIRMKITSWDGKQRAKAEYDDCKKAANKFEVSLIDVVNAAQNEFLKSNTE
jgi:uncharacterized protein (TIGR00299 family) protein